MPHDTAKAPLKPGPIKWTSGEGIEALRILDTGGTTRLHFMQIRSTEIRKKVDIEERKGGGIDSKARLQSLHFTANLVLVLIMQMLRWGITEGDDKTRGKHF